AELFGRDRRLGDGQARLVQKAEQIADYPVRGEPAVTPARDHLEEIGGLAISDQHARVVYRDAIILDEPALLLVRKLRQRRLDLVDPGLIQLQRQEIGIREIAIVVRLLLAPHRAGFAAGCVEQARLLIDRAAVLEDLDLPARLVLDRLADEPDRVHVLDLAARAERLPGPTHREVHVAAQRTLIHIAVAGAEITEDRAQLGDVGRRLLRSPQVRLGDDLHESDARAVQIDVALGRMLVVQALARVLLHVQARDADLLDRAVRQIDQELPLSHDRPRILRDLVSLRQVRIEIILPVEHRNVVDLRFQAEPRPHRLLDAIAVDDRQHAGHRRIDEADLAVRLRAESSRGSREQLRVRDDLGVHLEPDHHLPLTGAPLERRHQTDPPSIVGSAVNSAASSSTRAARSTPSSSKARPMSWRPSGRPSPDRPAGTEIAGRPARLAGTVKTSFRYMAIGSSIFSPIGKAAVGAVGVRMASTFSYARAKSCAILARTFCAFR